MKNDLFSRIMPFLVNISLGAWGLGVLFKIQHWPYGITIATIGMISYIVLSQIEFKRLRKIIANLNNEGI
jgi:hypothetical protein